MTLKEMISWIDVYSKNTTSDSMPVEALQIIAALKAGQAMCLDLQTIAKDKAEETGEPIGDFEYFSAKAWVAATETP